MKPRHLTWEEAYTVMITEDRKRRETPQPKQSCPQGLTEADLRELLGGVLPHFRWWMRGQTESVCDGRRYHHDRQHDDYCKTDFLPGTKWFEKGHTERDEFSWRCGYTGTGYYEPTVCADSPHGVVTYRGDVERYLAGLPVID